MFCPAISIFFRIQTEKKTITHRVTGEILPADTGSLILGGKLLPADIGLLISGPSVFSSGKLANFHFLVRRNRTISAKVIFKVK